MKDRAAIALDRIDDYVRGAGSNEDAESFEDDLFARALDRRAPELATYGALVTTLRELAERGTLEAFITSSQAAEIRARYGERVAYLELRDAATQTVIVPSGAELVLTRMPIDGAGLGDEERLDLEVFIQGAPIKTMPDVQFRRAEGALYLCCEGSLARQAAGFPVVTLVYVHGREGRRLLAESLVHTELGA